ncbi:hypothetical protein YC2023_120633 [Brassica napus]
MPNEAARNFNIKKIVISLPTSSNPYKQLKSSSFSYSHSIELLHANKPIITKKKDVTFESISSPNLRLKLKVTTSIFNTNFP